MARWSYLGGQAGGSNAGFDVRLRFRLGFILVIVTVKLCGLLVYVGRFNVVFCIRGFILQFFFEYFP